MFWVSKFKPMETSFDHWQILFLVAAAQGTFLGAILMTVKSLDKKNMLLGLLMGLFSLSLLDNVWFWSGYFMEFPHLLGVSLAFPYLYGVVLFFYFKEAIRSNSLQWRKLWPHFLVPVTVLAYLGHYYFSPTDTKLMLTMVWHESLMNSVFLPVGGMISMIFYLILIRRALVHFRHGLGVKLMSWDNWLTQIWMAFGTFISLFLINYILIFARRSNLTSDYLIATGYAVFIYFIGYLGFSKSKLLNGIKANDLKYQSSTITPTAGNHLYLRVQTYLSETRIYTNSQLRLSSLADQLAMTPHQLSQIINEQAEMNFSDFINRYRVEEAKKQMSADTRINLLAFDVGFNNRTSFNVAFKKFEGCSPSAYRQQQIQKS